MEHIITTDSLTKRYGKKYVVKNLDLCVPTGSIYGFLGPNGAGKSTTMKMLLGLAKPTSGEIRIFGVPVEEKNRLKIRKLTMKDIRREKYGQKMFRLINECYKDLYGYSLLSEKQMDQYVKQYLTFIDLRMVSFIEDEAGELVACGVTLPSLASALRKAHGRLFPFGWAHLLNALYLNRSDTLDLLLVATKPEYRNKGLNSIMFYDLIPSLIELGFKYAESNPELETNLRVQTLWSAFENKIHKRRRVYTKKLV